jgi:hypothetical protein
MSVAILSNLIGMGPEAKAVMAVITLPEPGTIPTLAVYGAGLGLFVWYYRKRAKRSKL